MLFTIGLLMIFYEYSFTKIVAKDVKKTLIKLTHFVIIG